jgi:hypothetical protein
MTYRSQAREIKGDDCDYLVDYDYQPEEKPVYNLNSPMCGPGCAAEVTINSIDIRPHGYSHWMPTDIAKWDMQSNVWDMLVREIEIDMLVSLGGDE